jgi:hypothetical protein
MVRSAWGIFLTLGVIAAFQWGFGIVLASQGAEPSATLLLTLAALVIAGGGFITNLGKHIAKIPSVFRSEQPRYMSGYLINELQVQEIIRPHLAGYLINGQMDQASIKRVEAPGYVHCILDSLPVIDNSVYSGAELVERSAAHPVEPVVEVERADDRQFKLGAQPTSFWRKLYQLLLLISLFWLGHGALSDVSQGKLFTIGSTVLFIYLVDTIVTDRLMRLRRSTIASDCSRSW